MSSKPFGMRPHQVSRSLPPKLDPKLRPNPQNLNVAGKASPSSDDTSDGTPATPTTPVARKVLIKKPLVPAKPVSFKPADTKTIPKPLMRSNRTLPKVNTETTPSSSPMRRTISTPTAPIVPSRPNVRATTVPSAKPPAMPIRRSTTSIPLAARTEPKVTPEKRISLLSQEIEEKVARVETLEILLKEAKEASVSLEEELAKVNAEKDLILKEKDEAQLASDDQLSRVSAELQTKLEAKVQQLKELEDQLLDSQFQVGSLTEEHDEELAQLKKQLQCSDQEVAQQNEKIQELLKLQEVAEARAVELASLKAELKAAREAHQNFMETSEQISGQLGHQIADYQQRLFNLQGKKNHPIYNEVEELRHRMEQKLQEEMDRTKACQAKAATFERAIFDLRARLDLSESSTQMKEALDLKDQLEAKLADEVQRHLESQTIINELKGSILVLEDKLTHSPSQEQLKELAANVTQLEAKLAQENRLKDESLEKITSLEASLTDLQQKLDHTSVQHDKAEQTCIRLEEQLKHASASSAESQATIAALETTILDLQKKLIPTPGSGNLLEIDEFKREFEDGARSEPQSGTGHHDRAASQDESISILENKLSLAKAQLDELSAAKHALSISFAAETRLVKEKQEKIIALQASLDAAPTLAQIQALEKAKAILTHELTVTTKYSQEKVDLLESEMVALKKELASVASSGAEVPMPYDSSDAPDKSVPFRHIGAELKECRDQLEASQKELAVARQLIKTLKEGEHASNTSPDAHCRTNKNSTCTQTQAKQYWNAREKELLLTIASLAAELEDHKYPPKNRQLQATYDAAIANSQKLARELSEAKHSSARKISALNAEKRLFRKELQAQETLNFELMQELEGQKHCHPPEY